MSAMQTITIQVLPSAAKAYRNASVPERKKNVTFAQPAPARSSPRPQTAG